ncbi:MAG: protein kinase [Erythrobacter sp.]|nr:MAG: protein kinase [Erythrobacter sp.]
MADISEGPKPPRKSLEPGRVLNNNYRLLKRIGEGGMGSVWLAENIFMEEDHVAIKVIRTEQADDDVFRQMFGKEVKAMLRLNNPHLVAYRTFAHDPELDLSFIVTEYIDGPSLKSLIGNRSFTPTELLSLLTELAIGLRAAHKAGIIHRDIAPDNVLLEGGDISRPKIIDFGIVKDTAGGETTIIGSGFAGKYGFVAPEQLGEPDYPIGPWTDIYSLGLVILGLARGQSIAMGNTPGSAIRMRREAPDLAPIAAPMRPLLADMLACHPDDRLRTADDVLARAEPIFAELANWEEDDELLPTVVAPTPAAPVGLMGGALAPEPAEDDEITQVVIGTSAVEPAQAEYPRDDAEYEDEEDEQRRHLPLGWIASGLISAIALAVAAGMALGEFASPFADQGDGGPDLPSPTATASAPLPLPSETIPPLDLPEALPAIAIATSVAPDPGATPIDPDSWVRQEDLPRQLFRGENVRGILAAYLTIVPDGTVSRCTVGSSSEVEPAEMLRPSAVGICRALSERARFEPFAEEEPNAEPGLTIHAQQQQRIGPAQTGPDQIAAPLEPQSREVFVRVAFRTAVPAIP